MSILVTGSIAYDHIMVFEDRFANHILPDRVHMLNVAFLVPRMERRWGGTGANIAYNLRALGSAPWLLATAGQDFAPYQAWMEEVGISRQYVRVLDDTFTAQAFITTDLDDNQITAFHPGAMDRAHEASVASVGGAIDVGIVAPNGKQAMLENAAALKQRGARCVIDPGQGLPMFDGDELRGMMEGAHLYVVNDYEWALTAEKTGLDENAAAGLAGAVIVTLGEKGARLYQDGKCTEVAALPAERVVDPTGCGDAFRAGLLHALEQGWTLERGARLGALLGSLKIARPGPQSIPVDPEAIAARFQEAYGEPLA